MLAFSGRIDITDGFDADSQVIIEAEFVGCCEVLSGGKQCSKVPIAVAAMGCQDRCTACQDEVGQDRHICNPVQLEKHLVFKGGQQGEILDTGISLQCFDKRIVAGVRCLAPEEWEDTVGVVRGHADG